MAYIAPNSIIKIMHNVPLDDTYNHTIKFASLSAQQTYFNSASVVKYTLDKQSYQRVERGKMRVEILSDNLYDCNYLAFQNTSFGTKWFYAFITSVEYVNDVTSEISFEIDVMQTYLFDITVGSCFVEREHVTDDTIGANTVSEPVEVPEAIISDVKPIPFGKWRVAIEVCPSLINMIAQFCVDICDGIIGATLPSESIPKAFIMVAQEIATIVKPLFQLLNPASQGEFREHMYSGSYIYITDHYIDFTNINVEEANLRARIDNLLATGNTVVQVYQVPEEVVTGFTESYTLPNDPIFSPPTFFNYTNKTGHYTPKNNKLFTSPYTYMLISNKQGGEMELSFEKIHDKKFYYDYSWSNGMVEVLLGMAKYGGYDVQDASSKFRLSITNFPICTFNSTSLISKLVQIAGKIGKDLGGRTVGAMTSAGVEPQAPTRQMGESGTEYFQRRKDFETRQRGKTVENYIEQLRSISGGIIGSSTRIKGNAMGAGADVRVGNFGFEIYRMGISGEYARIIDNFFERFGYAVKLNKVPNMDTRPHWNYVKTTDAYITGNCPEEYLRQIIDNFNHGITFWKNPSEVGNYSLNNH